MFRKKYNACMPEEKILSGILFLKEMIILIPLLTEDMLQDVK